MVATAATVPLLIIFSACSAADDPAPTPNPALNRAEPMPAAAEPTPGPGSGPAPPTSTGPIGAANVPLDTTIDVPGSRAAIEAAQNEVRRVLENALGTNGWTEMRPAQEVACPSRTDESGELDDGIGKFYAREMSHPETLGDDDDAAWARVWDEIVRAVEPHGFRPKGDDLGDEVGAAASGAARYLYLINSHQDELTVSTHPTIGTGYGGFGVCHPWGD